MTFLDLLKKFPTEKDIVDYYVHIRYGEHAVCNHCGSIKVYQRSSNSKVFDCNDCGNTFSPFNGKSQHNFDIIYGVMSDSVPTKLLIDYQMGVITKEMVLDGIKKPNSMKQLSLHNQELCDIIKPSRVYCYDMDTQCRKELDALVYNKR